MELHGRVRRAPVSAPVRDQQNRRRFRGRQIAIATRNQINSPDVFRQDLLS